jgi:hypothetical protein
MDNTPDNKQVAEEPRVARYTGQPLFGGDCPGCGVAWPDCDCHYYEQDGFEEEADAEAEAREALYTAWEIVSG